MNKVMTLLAVVAVLATAMLTLGDAFDVDNDESDYDYAAQYAAAAQLVKKRGILQGFSIPIDLRDLASNVRKIRADEEGAKWTRERRRLPKSLIRAIASDKAQHNRAKFFFEGRPT